MARKLIKTICLCVQRKLRNTYNNTDTDYKRINY